MRQSGENPIDSQDPSVRRHKAAVLGLRILAWTVFGLACVVVVALAVVVSLINTQRGHSMLIGVAQDQAAKALGVPVRLENFALHPSTLSLDLYGIRVSGAAPHADPPLLEADHVGVGVRIVSLFRGKWYFDNIQIDHPVAWVLVDKHGVSNIPVIKSSGSSHTDLFQLGIRHFQLTRGEAYYNARPAAVSADVHDLQFISTFNSQLTRYSGSLSYSNGRLVYGTLRPLEHNLEVDFDATPDTFVLRRGTISAGNSTVNLNATLRNYSHPEVQAQYDVVLDGAQVGHLLNEPQVPAGMVHLSGNAQYMQSADRSLLDSLALSGNLSSARLEVVSGQARIAVESLAAQYSLANGDAALHGFRAGLLGGTLTVEGGIRQLAGNQKSSFQVALHKVSLARMRAALGRSLSTGGVSLNGEANANAAIGWTRSIENLTAHANLSLNGNATRQQSGAVVVKTAASAAPSPSGAVVPFQGQFNATYTNADRNLTFSNSSLRTTQTTLTLNGTAGRHSSLAIGLQANDLSEISAFAALFQGPSSSQSNLQLSGRASFQGKVSGSLSAPSLTGQFTANNLGYNGTQWKLLQTSIGVDANHASLSNLRLQSAQQGQVTGSANLGLHDWKPASHSAIQVELNASQLNVAQLTALAGQQIPVTGTLNVTAHLRGEAMNPTGSATVTLTKAAAYGEPITQAKVALNGSGNHVTVTASVQLPAGSIQAQMGADPVGRTFQAQLSSSGIDLGKVQAIKARGIQTVGSIEMQAKAQGSFDNPAIQAELSVPRLTAGGQTISQTTLQVNEADHVANAVLSTSIASASLHGSARLNLTGDDVIDASLDTQTFPLQPFLAAYAPGDTDALSGQAEIHLTVHGPLKNKNQLQVHLKVPVLKMAYNNAIQLAATPIQADYQNGTITLQPVTLQGTDTRLALQGVVPIENQAAASLKAEGTVNLQVLQIFDPELRAGGRLNVNVDSHGKLGSGSLNGQVELAGVSLATSTSPVSFQDGNGVLKLTSDRVDIEKFSGRVGGGQVTALGGIAFRPSLQMDLGLAAKGVTLLYPQGLRETADASLRLTGSMTQANLGGSINLTGLSFTPAFDLTSMVNQFSGVQTPSEPGFAQNLNLNIALNSSNDTDLVSRTLSVNGSANLQIRGTAADPVVLGRVNLTSGDVILNGNRFVLTGGTVQFINPSMTQPVMNVALTTTIQEYKIDLRFQGPSDQLRTRYSSDPSLPPADIINLLAFGRTTEASAMNTESTNQEAEGLVASQVSSQVTSRLSKAAGISQLSISPVLAGGTAEGPPGANLTIQQRITGNLFVTFSTNVATTQGQTIQGQYQVSPRVAISATRDPNGGFALDTLIKKSW